MTEYSQPDAESVAHTQSTLRELAASLRGADHLTPETQQALANLLDELSTELNPASPTSAKTLHLALAASEVAHSLNERHDSEVVATARDRLKDAAVRAEVEAPVTTGVITRMLDLLASIGI